MGIPAVAISLAMMGEKATYYRTAADFTLKFCRKLFRKEIPAGALFNINVPNVKSSELQGWEVTRLGKRNYGDVIVEKTDPRGRLYYWIGGDQESFYQIKNSDCMAVEAKKVSITPLKTDLSDRPYMKKLNEWLS